MLGRTWLPVVLTLLAPLAVAQHPRACHRSARVLYQSARVDADAEFWKSLAEILHDPGANFAVGYQEALDEREEALAEAARIYQARGRVCDLIGHGIYDPVIVPTDFSPTVDNPFMPLVPGRTHVYLAHTPEGLERIEITPLEKTVVIDGVTCRAVREYETLDGVLTEDTENWYAQHKDGSVWYFGEIVLQYEDGLLDNLGGSWRAGKDGGRPGIVMPAEPKVGQAYRQEYLMDVAEDLARVRSIGDPVSVPYSNMNNAVVIEEWDPLEPLEWVIKYWVRDIGFVLEVDLVTGQRTELVEIQN